MHTAGLRRERLAKAMRQALSEILIGGMKDPRLAGVVVSAVELSGDLKVARAFFSVVGDQERERQVADALQQARGYLRRELGRRLRIHNAPDLEFLRDLGYERADRIDRILSSLPPRQDDEPSDETTKPEEPDND